MVTRSTLGDALQAHQRLAEVVRLEYGRVLSILVHHLRDLDLAEDALGDALTRATERWPSNGTPSQPAAWLLTVARRCAIDRMRRRDVERRTAPLLVVDDVEDPPTIDDDGIGDERLRLLFTACHPALSRESQAALTLRVVAGLDTATIARVFVVGEATMAQRISRAKAKIRDAGIPYEVPPPSERPGRVAGVLAVIYLIFTEGHTVGRGGRLLRVDLQEEAIRLARVLVRLLPDDAEARGLLALLLLTAARTPARVIGRRAVPLAQQDRSRWDQGRIAEGLALLDAELTHDVVGVYVAQAAIAGVHARAASYERTDWSAIVGWYDAMLAGGGSDVVRLNRAIAVMESGDVAAARAQLEALASSLADFSHLHAALAEARSRDGDSAGAVAAATRALALTDNDALRRHLERRRTELAAALADASAGEGPQPGATLDGSRRAS